MTETEKLIKEIEYLKNHSVEIGILAVDAKLKNKDNGATILEYAIYNEFGTPSIPPRAFMRQALTNKDLIRALIRNVTKSVVKREKKAKEALMELGESIRGIIIATIADANSWATANKESTLKNKTRNGNLNNTKVLIDNRFLIKSIRYQIVDKKGKIEYLSDFKGV